LKVVPPREPERAAELRKVLRELSTLEYAQVVHEWNTWVATVDDGREVLGVLNGRYDLCVLECGAPAPWLVAAFDTQRRELVLVKFVPRDELIVSNTCAHLAAQALDETIVTLVFY
jgi:hypothetical protein